MREEKSSIQARFSRIYCLDCPDGARKLIFKSAHYFVKLLTTNYYNQAYKLYRSTSTEVEIMLSVLQLRRITKSEPDVKQGFQLLIINE